MISSASRFQQGSKGYGGHFRKVQAYACYPSCRFCWRLIQELEVQGRILPLQHFDERQYHGVCQEVQSGKAGFVPVHLHFPGQDNLPH